MNLSKRELLILNIIIKNKTVTATSISDQLNVSIRTIKSDIIVLKQKLSEESIFIKSTPGLGYSFDNERSKSSEKEILKLLKESVDSIRSFSTNYDRLIFILKKLINSSEGINIDDLSDEMYISISSLRNDLKSLKEIVYDFNIKLITTKNKNIKLKGSEFDKRNLIFEYFPYPSLGGNLNIEYLSEKLIESMQEGIVLSDYTINNIASFTLIALKREKQNHNLIYSKIVFDDKKVFELTKKYIDYIIDEFNISINSHTTLYIFNQIKNKQVYYDDRLINKTVGIDYVIDLIINESKTNFEIDFSSENDFIYSLKLHIAALIQRVKNKMSTNIDIDYDHLRKYLFACKMTISAVDIIEKYYKIEVPMDEFVLLVYYFNSEILKKQRYKCKVIGFVSSRGRAENLMFLNHLQNNFYLPKYDVVTFENAHHLKKYINEVDLVVSSNNKLSHELENKIVIDIKNADFVKNIRDSFHLQMIKNIELKKYFLPEYLVFDIKGHNRQEVMSSLINHLKNADVFYVDRSKKFQFKDIELGNGVLMLQDIYKLCKKPVFLVVYLENPIIWRKELITTITLIKTKKDGDKDLPSLCTLLSAWISDKKKIKDVYQNKDYKYFINSILRVNIDDNLSI